jgi:hypothetical protein
MGGKEKKDKREERSSPLHYRVTNLTSCNAIAGRGCGGTPHKEKIQAE